MQKSRMRQFNMTRDKNLSQTYSQIGRVSNCNESLYREAAFNQSSNAFNKKSKIPVCTNCVNKKLVEDKKERVEQQRQREIMQRRRKEQEAKNYRDKAKEIRTKMLKQAEEYNKKVAKRQLASVQSAKQFDTVYMQEVSKREKEAQEQERIAQLYRIEREQKYREQLRQQYDAQLTKRQIERQIKLKAQPDKPLINSYSSRHLRLKYAQQLKKQIQKQKRTKQERKILQRQVNKKAISYSQTQFLEYTQFKSQRPSQINPEIFDEMKEIQQKRRRQKIQKRQAEQQHRKIQEKINKQQLLQKSQRDLQNTKKYASVLEEQIRQRHNAEEYQKEAAKRFREEPFFEYTEDQVRHKEACGECHSQVNELGLSYY